MKSPEEIVSELQKCVSGEDACFHVAGAVPIVERAILDALGEGNQDEILRGALKTALACGDVQREKVRELDKSVIYFIRALGSVAHVCATEKDHEDLPGRICGIVERAIRGVPHPIREEE